MRMTVEADFGFMGRLLQPEIRRDATGTLVQQDVVGARVLVGAGPCEVFVLQDRRIFPQLDRTVAETRCASDGAERFVRGLVWQRLRTAACRCGQAVAPAGLPLRQIFDALCRADRHTTSIASFSCSYGPGTNESSPINFVLHRPQGCRPDFDRIAPSHRR